MAQLESALSCAVRCGLRRTRTCTNLSVCPLITQSGSGSTLTTAAWPPDTPCRRLWGEDDGHRARQPDGLAGIVQHRPDRRPANDVVDGGTVEPSCNPARAASAHTALHRREELLAECVEELGVELTTPVRLGSIDASQQ